MWLENKEPPSVEEIHRRLRLLVLEPLDPEGFARREIAARVVFVMLYGFAVEANETWIRPTTVTDMTDEQAAQTVPEDRRAWLQLVQSRKRPRDLKNRWYGENTRESIRDETLRRLIDLGIAVERPGLATTSPRPRYALTRDFVALCDPGLTGSKLDAAMETWRQEHLSKASLARVALLRTGAGSEDGVSVRLPNEEVRRLSAGPSSLLTKSVVEVFAPRFLEQPAVILMSESAKKVSYQDERMLKIVDLDIDGISTLPDLVLADIGRNPLLLVFVECVATAGEITESRREKLAAMAIRDGYRASDCAFVTVFRDRVKSRFRACSTSLAWGSFVWFETEPEQLIYLRNGREQPMVALTDFLRVATR